MTSEYIARRKEAKKRRANERPVKKRGPRPTLIYPYDITGDEYIKLADKYWI